MNVLRRAVGCLVGLIAPQLAFGIVATRVLDERAGLVSSNGEEVWARSWNAVYKITAKGAVRVFPHQSDPSDEAAGISLARTSNAIWFVAHQTLYRVENDRPLEIATPWPVERVESDHDGLVVSTRNSVLRYRNGQFLEIFTEQQPVPGLVLRIESAGHRVFVNSASGDYIIRGDQVAYLGRHFSIAEHKNTVLLYDDRSLYRLGEKDSLKTIADNLQLASMAGTDLLTFFGREVLEDEFRLRLADGGILQIFQPGGPVQTYSPSRPGIVLGKTTHGYWVVSKFHENPATWIERDGMITPVLNAQATRVAEAGDATYFSTSRRLADTDNLYRWRNGHVSVVIPDTGTIWELRSRKGRVYVTADHGVYVVENDIARRLTFAGAMFLQELGGRLWYTGSPRIPLQQEFKHGGTFRIDEDVDIVYDVISDSSLQPFLPKGWTVSGFVHVGPRYERRSTDRPFDELSAAQTFTSIVSTDPRKFGEALTNAQYQDAARAFERVSVGRRTLFVAVRDSVGNTVHFTQPLFVIPGPLLMSTGLAGALVLAALIAFVLAPVNEWCHLLILNPFVRRIGSFGLIPILLTVVPAARAHLLQRHRRQIITGFDDEATGFVVPAAEFDVDRFTAALASTRSLALIGVSGIGKTAYLKYLAWTTAHHRLLRKAIPIYVDLAHIAEEVTDAGFADAVFNEIHSLVRSDQESDLVPWMVAQGRFLILFDSMNEVSAAVRAKAGTFFRKYRDRNYFVFASQEAYEVIREMRVVSFAPLGDEEVREFVRSRLGDISEAVLTQLVAHREIYSVPQNLELAIEILQRGRAVPQSKAELYRHVLVPIITASTASEEMPDYAQPLLARSYEMLRKREPHLDDDAQPLPTGLVEQLTACKLIVSRDGRHYFRHELIRSYLASEHLRSTWRITLGKEVELDLTWLPALEILTATLQPSEIYDLLLMLLGKNSDLAIRLFNSIDTASQAYDWVTTFQLAVGRSVLQSGPEQMPPHESTVS